MGSILCDRCGKVLGRLGEMDEDQYSRCPAGTHDLTRAQSGILSLDMCPVTGDEHIWEELLNPPVAYCVKCGRQGQL